MHTNTSDGAAAALAGLTSLIKEKHMTDQPVLAESTPKAPRSTHTPAERATEAVNVLQRRLDKLTKSKAALELQALELEPQIEAIHRRIDYALSNPDLPVVEQFEEVKQFEEAQQVSAQAPPWGPTQSRMPSGPFSGSTTT